MQTVPADKIEKDYIVSALTQSLIGRLLIANDFNRESFLVHAHLESAGQKVMRFYEQ
jgi:hypothetical protein